MSDRLNRRRVALATIAGAALLATSVAQADIDSAREALSEQHYPQAMQALDAVLANKPNDPEARFLKGLTLAREQQSDKAIALFEQLTADYPDMAEAWNNLGVLYARQSELAKAKKALEKAVALDANYGPAQENLGDVYVALAQNAYSTAGKVEDNSSAVEKKSAQLADFLKKGTSIGSAKQRSAPAMKTEPMSQPKPIAKPVAVAKAQQAPVAKAPATSTHKTTPPRSPSTAAPSVPADTSTPRATLKTWAAAWSAQNVDRYLSMYAAGFQPAHGRSRSAWEALRRKRVGAPSRIRVDIAQVQVDRRGTQARVTFNQHYQSPTYQDRERKALLMTETADGWRILHEGVADAVGFTPADGDSAQSAKPSAPSSSAGDDKSPAGSDSAPAAPAASAADHESAGSDPSAARAHVVAALKKWAQAWSKQNVQMYLAAYSDDYEPQGGQSLADWIKQRGNHFKSGKHTQATLADIKVAFDNPNRAIATFDERYQSPNQPDDEQKRVVLVREDGGWRIKKES